VIAPGRADGGRILVVEDDQRIASVLVKAFERTGQEVVVAADGDVGLFLATTDRFDVVLLDLGLPGQSGMALLHGISRVRPDLPVVMLTGRDNPSVRAGCMDAGASSFVTKPFIISELRGEIDRFLPQRPGSGTRFNRVKKPSSDSEGPARKLMTGAETVWVLTDSRYLAQRMPGALVTPLRALHRRRVVVVCADRLVTEVGCAGGWAPRAGDLVVPRTRSPFALELLAAAERAGVTCLNSWSAVAAVRDKPRAALMLATAGVAMPRTWLADNPRALRDVPASAWPLLLKPHLGDNARGIVKVADRDGLDRLSWTDGMVLAQQYVDVDGVDLKLYGAGEAVWAVRRPSPLRASVAWCEPVTVTADLRRLARTCAATFNLTAYGVDVLDSAAGPLVVDVNDFPNYTGVDEAPEVLSDLVATLLTGAVTCAW